MTALTTESKIAGALAALTVEEKVQLLTGRDFWTTWPIEKIGLRRILVSDGPSGIRGETSGVPGRCARRVPRRRAGLG
jgi:beta-glucosidase